jgi:hypothetical protein
MGRRPGGTAPKSPDELLHDLDAAGEAFSQAAQQEFGGKGEW